jgi:hypothetical protein
LNDSSLFQFIEDLKRDKDLIVQILYGSHNEMAVFLTYLLVILKKLNPIDHSFTNTMHMCKELAMQINDEAGSQSNYATQSAIV